jgi:YVTN family beta-propeller protein
MTRLYHLEERTMSTMTEGTVSKKYFGGIGRLSIVLMLGVLAAFSSSAQAAPFAYITDSDSNAVSVIDTASNTVVATIPVGGFPRGVAANRAGTV